MKYNVKCNCTKNELYCIVQTVNLYINYIYILYIYTRYPAIRGTEELFSLKE